MESTKKKFRGSMFGFNKKDVNEYIIFLNNELGNRIHELEEQNQALEEQKSSLISEVTGLSNENINLQNKNNITIKSDSELRQEVEALKPKLSALNAEKEELVREKEELISQNESQLNALVLEKDAQIHTLMLEKEAITAESANSKKETEAMQERIILMETERGYIADAILTAKHEAERIVTDAHTEANKVYAEMERDVQMLKDRIRAENERIDVLRMSAQQAIAQYMDNLDKIEI